MNKTMEGREYETERECWLLLQGDKASACKSFDSTLESQEFSNPGEVRVHTTVLMLWGLNFLEPVGSLEHGLTHIIGRQRYHDIMVSIFLLLEGTFGVACG